MATFPETQNWGEYRSHFFSIPGLTFNVEVGKRIPEWLRDVCLWRGRGRPLFYTDAEDLVNMRDFARLARFRDGSGYVSSAK
jgi:hypothetical protein